MYIFVFLIKFSGCKIKMDTHGTLSSQKGYFQRERKNAREENESGLLRELLLLNAPTVSHNTKEKD
ncbi:hypothetical protein NOC27_2705 [Nitrosococcus oceani AFC27]|nr:hypothetical protein NOC27_2705 [Nitrosococcus oceani AFC27]GEM21580.1 hypothetical protein NONS58_30250 [Nitrosococcus oceani]